LCSLCACVCSRTLFFGRVLSCMLRAAPLHIFSDDLHKIAAQPHTPVIPLAHTRTCTHAHVRIQTHTLTNIQTCTYAYTHAHTCTHTLTHTSTLTHSHTHTHTHSQTLLHTHTHTKNTHRNGRALPLCGGCHLFSHPCYPRLIQALHVKL